MRGVSHLEAEVALAHQDVLPPEASELGQVDGSRASEPLMWSSNFTIDQTKDGRTMRVLCVLDDCTRECLCMEIDFSCRRSVFCVPWIG